MKDRRSWFSKRRVFIGFCAFLCAYGIAALVLILNGLEDDIQRADVALVLGSKVDSMGIPSARLAARLDRAVALFAEGQFGHIIVSGGTGKEGYPEGDAMRRYLVEKGVPADAVVVDNSGVTTRASAENTAATMASMNMKSVMVISQYFHIPRSKLALQKAGVTQVFNAHAHFFEMRDIYSILREVPAYAKYAVQ